MQLTTNTRSFIEAEQYSDFILLNLHDGLLPEAFYRDISDFQHGSNLHIKTVGTVTLQDAAEDTPLIYNPIETGEIMFHITQYVGDAWYVTDDLREDGTNIDMLMTQRATESTRSYQERVETDFLAAAAGVYTGSNTNFAVNGFAHKVVSAQNNNTISLAHFIAMRLAFDKAQVPEVGRVAIVDPTVEATLNGLVTITSNITPFAQEILKTGLSRGMRFTMNLYGWDILISNRLYQGAANDGTTSLANGVYNLFMCILDDQTKPIMHAVRRQPKVEGERNKDKARDEFIMRARYGFGAQRIDTLGTVITDPTKY